MERLNRCDSYSLSCFIVAIILVIIQVMFAQSVLLYPCGRTGSEMLLRRASGYFFMGVVEQFSI